ncbi:MAG TPA: hypothetical protein VM536_15335 [Chloroflexia bacterium]|nr:hypothetical protein [Chloroflexia bacterium]
MVAGLVGLLYAGLLAWLWDHFHGDPLGFVHQGTVWLYPQRQGTNGYDGQFYFYIAQHPFHAVAFLDLPSIRLQRIFFPLLIDLVALGQRPLMPYAMLLINWLAVVCGTWLVARLLRRWGRSPWFALSYALAAGIPVALQFDTPEPLAFALVALGVTCWERGSSPAGEPPPDEALPDRRAPLRVSLLIVGTLAFAAALLTREHTIYFVAAYAAAALLRRDWRQLGAAVATLVPVTIWGAYLSATLGKSSLSQIPVLEYIPFVTYWVQGNLVDPTPRSAGYAAQYIVPAAVFGVLAIGTLAGIAVRGVRTRRWAAPAPLLLALLGNVHLLTFLPLQGYQHQVAASRYALGLALAAVLWAGSTRPRWLLWLTPLCAAGLLAYLYGLLTQDPAYLW